MSTKRKCTICRGDFEHSSCDNQSTSPNVCPSCSSDVGTSLSALSGLAVADDPGKGPAALRDLRESLIKLGQPIDEGWFANVDQQIADKKGHAARVLELANQRTQVAMSLAALARSMADMRTAELDARLDVLQKRVKTLVLERQIRALERNAQPKGEPQPETDRFEARRTQLEQRQAEATQFLKEVDAAFRSDRSDQERRLYIRLAMEAFEGEFADLPEEVRAFMTER